MNLNLNMMNKKPDKQTKMLTLNGTTSYVTSPKVWTSTGIFEITLVFVGANAWEYLIDGDDATNRGYCYSDNGTIQWNAAEFDATGTLDGVSISNGTESMPTDGKLHTLVLTGNNATTKVGHIGVRYSLDAISHHDGIIKSLTLTDITTPANSRTYTFNSGSDLYELPDGVNVGDNLVTNGDFSDGLTGWTATNTDANNIVSVDNDALKFNSDGSLPLNVYQVLFEVGKTYKITLNVEILAGDVAGLKIQDGGGDENIGALTSTQLYTFTHTAEDDTLYIYRRTGSSASQAKVDNISVRELPLPVLYQNVLATDWNKYYYELSRSEWIIRNQAPMHFFKITIRTTTPDEAFIFPATATNDFHIYWGDGSIDHVTTANPSHTYAIAGDYEVWVTGTCPDILFDGSGSELQLIGVDNLGRVGWSGSLYSGFRDCTNLEYFIGGSTDTSSVTNMNNMMLNWTAMTTPPDLSNVDTSSVTNMASMMYNWTAMTTPPDLSNVDTSSVTNMAHMMRNWTSMGAIDIPIDTWNIGLVTDMTNMLSGTTLTTACYDRTLIAWEAQGTSNVTAHFGNSKYTAGGAAETARTALTGRGWVITDGGTV